MVSFSRVEMSKKNQSHKVRLGLTVSQSFRLGVKPLVGLTQVLNVMLRLYGAPSLTTVRVFPLSVRYHHLRLCIFSYIRVSS